MLAEVRSTLDQMKLEEKEFQSELSSCTTTITNHKDDLARSEIRYRQLMDNRKLFQNENDLKLKEKQLMELEEKTHGLK